MPCGAHVVCRVCRLKRARGLASVRGYTVPKERSLSLKASHSRKPESRHHGLILEEKFLSYVVKQELTSRFTHLGPRRTWGTPNESSTAAEKKESTMNPTTIRSKQRPTWRCQHRVAGEDSVRARLERQRLLGLGQLLPSRSNTDDGARHDDASCRNRSHERVPRNWL